MQRSLTKIYLHLVWATYRRLPLVSAEIEPLVHRFVAGEARRQRCVVLAIGGMPDHIHLAVRMPATLAVARLMQQVKGVSSTRIRQEVLPGEIFGWQDNYAAFSISRSHVDRVVRYIEHQKQHHGTGTLSAGWERVNSPGEES
jgi:REP element-mobilizing transposase RayT